MGRIGMRPILTGLTDVVSGHRIDCDSPLAVGWLRFLEGVHDQLTHYLRLRLVGRCR